MENIKIIETDNNIELKFDDNNIKKSIFLNMISDNIKNYNTMILFMNKIIAMLNHNSDYSNYFTHIMENKKLNSCVFLNDISTKFGEISYEFGPIFNKQDIIELIILKKLLDHKIINSFIIMEEFIKCLYEDMFLFIPISKYLATNKTHDTFFVINPYDKTKYFLDIDLYCGNLELFFKKFNNYFNSRHLDTLRVYKEIYNNNKRKSANLNDKIAKLDKFLLEYST